MKSIRDAEVRDQTVFLRVDFNVPFVNGKISDNNRIKSAIPTIKLLQEKRAKIVIGTHIGRPAGVDLSLSTVPVARELSKLLENEVYSTDLVISPIIKNQITEMKNGQVLLLGNLRYDPREEKNDPNFAKELAEYADLYVNDAFAVSHRANASVEAITNYLDSYAGLLLESEITSLSFLLGNPQQPFVVIIGGAKIKDKAYVIKHLAEKADRILIGGAVASTFLKAKGENVGKSLIEDEMIPECKKMLLDYSEKIVLPVDTVKEEGKTADEFIIYDIGKNTQELFAHEISNAKSVFWNGNMGYTEDEKYVAGTRAVAMAMKENHTTTVVAGGDTVNFINMYNLKDGFSFVSTGGGAAMEFMAGQKLPGIEALNRTSSEITNY